MLVRSVSGDSEKTGQRIREDTNCEPACEAGYEIDCDRATKLP